MRVSLARLLAVSVQEAAAFRTANIDQKRYLEWVDKYQAQLVVLAAQIIWSESMDKALLDTEQGKGKAADGTTPVQQVMKVVEATLNVLADSVLHEQPPVRRRKLEHLVSVSACFYIFVLSYFLQSLDDFQGKCVVLRNGEAD